MPAAFFAFLGCLERAKHAPWLRIIRMGEAVQGQAHGARVRTAVRKNKRPYTYLLLTYKLL